MIADIETLFKIRAEQRLGERVLTTGSPRLMQQPVAIEGVGHALNVLEIQLDACIGSFRNDLIPCTGTSTGTPISRHEEISAGHALGRNSRIQLECTPHHFDSFTDICAQHTVQAPLSDVTPGADQIREDLYDHTLTLRSNLYHHPIMSDSYQPQGPRTGADAQTSLYGVNGIVIGTFIGSLAAAVVMLYLNYSALGRDGLARTVATWGAGFCLALIALTTQLPNSPLTSFVMISVQALIAYFLSTRLQAAAIAYHQQHGGAIHSNLRAAGVGALTGLAILIGLMMVGILWAVLTGGQPATGT